MTGTWRNEAACLGAPTDVFYPIGDGNTVPEDAEPAKAHCRRCPVIEECLDHALAIEGSSLARIAGVWGGCTPAERIEIRKIRNLGKAA